MGDEERSLISTMKQKLLRLFSFISLNTFGYLNLCAERGDYGRELMDDNDSPLGTLILFILLGIGFVIYHVFESDEKGKEGRGCMAVIAFIVLAFFATCSVSILR